MIQAYLSETQGGTVPLLLVQKSSYQCDKFTTSPHELWITCYINMICNFFCWLIVPLLARQMHSGVFLWPAIAPSSMIQIFVITQDKEHWEHIQDMGSRVRPNSHCLLKWGLSVFCSGIYDLRNEVDHFVNWLGILVFSQHCWRRQQKQIIIIWFPQPLANLYLMGKSFLEKVTQ